MVRPDYFHCYFLLPLAGFLARSMQNRSSTYFFYLSKLFVPFLYRCSELQRSQTSDKYQQELSKQKVANVYKHYRMSETVVSVVRSKRASLSV